MDPSAGLEEAAPGSHPSSPLPGLACVWRLGVAHPLELWGVLTLGLVGVDSFVCSMAGEQAWRIPEAVTALLEQAGKCIAALLTLTVAWQLPSIAATLLMPALRGAVPIVKLAGLAVCLLELVSPFGQHGCGGSPISQARQDLDTLRNAVNLYESRFRPLTGDDPGVLLGVVMQEIPADPWGRPYLLDGHCGLFRCYGADGRPGGEGLDGDIVVRFRASPKP